MVNIQLSEEEALVLFDLLSDYGEGDNERALAVRHAAERNALWVLLASLEKTLVAPFQSDYDDHLRAAREQVEKQGGSW